MRVMGIGIRAPIHELFFHMFHDTEIGYNRYMLLCKIDTECAIQSTYFLSYIYQIISMKIIFFSFFFWCLIIINSILLSTFNFLQLCIQVSIQLKIFLNFEKKEKFLMKTFLCFYFCCSYILFFLFQNCSLFCFIYAESHSV